MSSMNSLDRANQLVAERRDKLSNIRVSGGADFSKSLQAILNELERVRENQKRMEEAQQRMATAFANALLKLGEKVEKIAGGEDSSFSLAHSLEKLIDVLNNRKFRIKRDSDGNMISLETDS
jgi:hypothetical protein